MWVAVFLISIGGVHSLLEEDGIFVRDEGKGLQVIATWNLLISIKHPHPPAEMYSVYIARRYFDSIKDVIGNQTYILWKRRTSVMAEALLAYSKLPSRRSGVSPYGSRERHIPQHNVTGGRSRRGLIDGVSAVGNWLFGLATQHQIDHLAESIQPLYNGLHSITHSVNGLVTLVNKSVQVQNNMAITLKLYGTSLGQTMRAIVKLQHVINQKQREVQRLEYILRGEQVIGELETLSRYWEKNCELFKRQERALQRGWLTIDLLKPDDLRSILNTPEYHLSSRALPMSWYYMNSKVSLLMWRGQEFVYHAALPMVSEDEYVMYSLLTIPVYTGEGDIWREVLNIPSQLGWDSRRGGTIDTKRCFGTGPTICPPEVHERNGRCVTGVLTGTQKDLKRCTIKLFTDDRQDMAIKIAANMYLISSRNRSVVRMHCLGKPESHAIMAYVKVYHIEAGCTMETDSWRVVGEYSRNLKVENKNEVHTVKGITLGFVISKLTDFKRVKKLVVSEPVLVNAGDMTALYVKPATMPRKMLVVSSATGASVIGGALLTTCIILIACRRRIKRVCGKQPIPMEARNMNNFRPAKYAEGGRRSFRKHRADQFCDREDEAGYLTPTPSVTPAHSVGNMAPTVIEMSNRTKTIRGRKAGRSASCSRAESRDIMEVQSPGLCQREEDSTSLPPL